MIKSPSKKLKKYQDQLKRSSRQLKYLIKYHARKQSSDVEAETITENQENLDMVVETIISNHSLTRIKIKRLIYFMIQPKGWTMAELYIDKFLDCLVDQAKRNKKVTLHPDTLADSKINPRSWSLFHKISAKRNRKK